MVGEILGEGPLAARQDRHLMTMIPGDDREIAHVDLRATNVVRTGDDVNDFQDRDVLPVDQP